MNGNANGNTIGYTHGEPYDEGNLKVGDIHTLHYSQYGRKDGLPVIFLHGGPGGGTKHKMTGFFNPEIYRVVLLDQRGSGQSTPSSDIRENTTAHLLQDIERLRRHLGVNEWHMVFGGSWGSTLSLLYAQAHPERVKCLVLRGIFTVRQAELTLEVPKKFVPEALDKLVKWLPENERSGDPRLAYYKRMTSKDPQVALDAAIEWNRYDLSMNTLEPRPNAFQRLEDQKWNMAHALIFLHFLVHSFWLEEGHILKPENMAKIAHIPVIIVQGRYDLICPPKSAWDLHKAWPGSTLHWITNAGHSASEPATRAKLVEACDQFATL